SLGMPAERLAAALSRERSNDVISGEILSRVFDHFMEAHPEISQAYPWNEFEILRSDGTGHRAPPSESEPVGESRIWFAMKRFHMSLAFSGAMDKLRIVRLADFSRVSAEDLTRFEGVGSTTLTKLRAALEEAGVYLRGEDPQAAAANSSDSFLNQPLSVIPANHVGTRELRLLQEAGILTIGDLVQRSEAQLREIKGFGGMSIIGLNRWLEGNGLSLRQDIAEDVLQRHLDDQSFDWTVRTRKGLVRMSVAGHPAVTVSDLVKASAEDLLSLKNFGLTSLVEVRTKLGRLGLMLKDDPPPFLPMLTSKEAGTSIEVLYLNMHIINGLKDRGILTLGDLMKYQLADDGTIDVPRIGYTGVRDIQAALARLERPLYLPYRSVTEAYLVSRGLHLKDEASQRSGTDSAAFDRAPALASDKISIVWTPKGKKPRIVATLGNDFYPGNIEGQWTIDWNQIPADKLNQRPEESAASKDERLKELDDFLRERGLTGDEAPRVFGLKLRASVFSDKELRGSAVSEWLLLAYLDSENLPEARERVMRVIAALTPHYFSIVLSEGHFTIAGFLNELDREHDVHEMTVKNLSSYHAADSNDAPPPAFNRLAEGVGFSRVMAVLSRLARGREEVFIKKYKSELIAEFLKLHPEQASDWEIEYEETDKTFILKRSVWTLNWDSQSRARRAIAGLGVETIEDLIRKTPEEVLGVSGVGVIGLNTIRRVLSEQGLILREDENSDQFRAVKLSAVWNAQPLLKLSAQGLETLGDLSNRTADELLAIPGFTNEDLLTVWQELLKRGLLLKEDLNNKERPMWPQVKISARFSDGKRYVVAVLGNGFTPDNLEGEWTYDENFLEESKTFPPMPVVEPLPRNEAAAQFEKILDEFQLTGQEDPRAFAFQLRAKVLSGDLVSEPVMRLRGALQYIWEHSSEVSEAVYDKARRAVAALTPEFYITFLDNPEFNSGKFLEALDEEQAIFKYSLVALPRYIAGPIRVAKPPQMLDTTRNAAILSRMGSNITHYVMISHERRILEEFESDRTLKNLDFSRLKDMKVEFKPLVLDNLLQQSVLSFDLHSSSQRIFSMLGVETLGELLQKTPDDILSLPGVGVTALNNLRDTLSLNGVALRDDDDLGWPVLHRIVDGDREHRLASHLNWVNIVDARKSRLTVHGLINYSEEELLTNGFVDSEHSLNALRIELSGMGLTLKDDPPLPTRTEWPQVKITAAFPDGERRVIAELGNGFTPDNLEGVWQLDEALLLQKGILQKEAVRAADVSPGSDKERWPLITGLGITYFPAGQFVAGQSSSRSNKT
nr:hypothetical protein [Candidatus Omnitrophota bacterium]